MEFTADIDTIGFDSLEQIKEAIEKRHPFQFKVFENYPPEEDASCIGIWIEDRNHDISATLFIDMTDNEALFLAEGIISMIKNKRPPIKDGE